MKKIKLDDIKKENIFQTPPEYFEDLPSIIQARIVKEKPHAWYSSLFSLPAMKLAIPAMLILLVFVFRGQLFSPEHIDVELSSTELIEELSTDEMYAYLMEHTDVTHEDLLEVALENHLFLGDGDKQLKIDEEYIEDLDIEDLEELL